MAFNSVVDAIVAKGSIVDADVRALRRCHADSKINKQDASRLFEINTACPNHSTTWTQFFTEALSDFVVHQMRPAGHVDEINAEWLVTHIDTDGKLESPNELELLIRILEQAKSVPASLNLYALNQVKHAVLTGKGVIRTGKTQQAGVITENDVETLRRVLYAYDSGDNIGITADEAELLFDINDATTNADNHPSWNVLFAQAIASHLMTAQGHMGRDRETALRHEKWLDVKPTGDRFLNTMVKGLRDIYKASGSMEGRKASIKANWLTARINKDGQITPAERAVLTFIKHESPDIGPVLRPLLDLVA